MAFEHSRTRLLITCGTSPPPPRASLSEHRRNGNNAETEQRGSGTRLLFPEQKPCSASRRSRSTAALFPFHAAPVPFPAVPVPRRSSAPVPRRFAVPVPVPVFIVPVPHCSRSRRSSIRPCSRSVTVPACPPFRRQQKSAVPHIPPFPFPFPFRAVPVPAVPGGTPFPFPPFQAEHRSQQ